MADGEPRLPVRGERLPDFSLASSEGRMIQLSQYRGRRNLAIAFTHVREREPGRDFLRDLAKLHSEFVHETTIVLAVIPSSVQDAKLIQQRDNPPFLVLADEEGRVHRAFGIAREPAVASVYVADRFGELYWSSRVAPGEARAAVDEMLSWLRFIETQCPECGAPAWPAPAPDSPAE